jgi:hypothetical protein
MRRLLKAIVTLVKTLPVAEGSVAELPADLALVVFVCVVRVATPTTPIATITTTVILETIVIWFGSTATVSMSSGMHRHGVQLLVFSLCLCDARRTSVSRRRE